ncbi:MAG: transketolase [Nanoarchaeota archaeon]|nr:transketolase [Nanoarchaeota archaeon]
MENSDLKDIASVLRCDSIEMTTSAGSGHPSSCLSAAEIMSVLFFHEMKYDVKNPENPDNDEFILSKGHAAPILYSCLKHAGCIKDDLNTLRKLNSNLEGHPIPRSSKWIKAATGSLGQGIGVAVGMALAAKLQNRNFRTYTILGDSEISEGSVYEALELASYYKLNNLVVIVDINRLGQRGETMLGHGTAEYKMRFEGFGCHVEIINGHSINAIIKSLDNARRSKKPTVILARTIKGKGVSFIEDKEGWHGKALNYEEAEMALSEIAKARIPKIIIEKPIKLTRKFKKSSYKSPKYETEEIATRFAYGQTLASLGKSDSSILAIDAETSNSTYSLELKKVRPKQFVEAFIAEQNMVSMATGLSIKGFNVFASTFAAFLSRAHDQIRMAAISSSNITFVGSHAGTSIGEDGGSQMGLEDISLFRSLAASAVFYPSDSFSAEKLTILASKLPSIKYIRTSRPKTPSLYLKTDKFRAGDFKVLKEGGRDSAVFVGSGITVHEALAAYYKLKKKRIHVAVVDLYSIKPFNHKKFVNFVNDHGKKIVLAEDHRPEGGIGEMIAEKLVGTKIKFKHLSITEIPHSGTSKELLHLYRIDSSAYINELKKKW